MYVELMNVFEEYKEFDLTIIGFPCAQFLKLEHPSDEDIIEFTRK